MKYLTALAAALIATSVGPPAPARSAIERLQSYPSSVGQHTRIAWIGDASAAARVAYRAGNKEGLRFEPVNMGI
jgi:hypothetical protein